jgi:hypothetical protein
LKKRTVKLVFQSDTHGACQCKPSIQDEKLNFDKKKEQPSPL